jgi:anaerobic magnesium-protoporphyrin IX monomethyl ester cyclase
MSDAILFLIPAVDAKGRNIVRDFVYGCWCNGRRVGGMQMPPLNELYCATHVRNAGLNVLFIDAQYEPERFDILIRNRFAGIRAVVMLSSTQSFRADTELLSRIKEFNGAIKTVLFGSHPTFMSNYCLKNHAVDYIVLREPEETLRCLLLAIANGNPVAEIEGIGYRNNGKVIINPFRPFVTMDDLPIPDRTLLPKGIDYFNPVVKRMPYTTMQTSRGCPGHCIFCTAPPFYGNKYRIRSSDRVLEELEVVKSFGYREVFFRDETFTAYRKRNAEICEGMIRKNLDLKWIANGRVDMIDKDAMILMKRAGCHMIKFGVESASNEILKNYKKEIRPEQTVKAFAMAQEVGLDTHAHIVLGGPGETLETIRQTLDFAKKIKASTASFGILTPYPGTELFDRVAKQYPEIMDGSDSTMENLHTQGFFSESICGISGKELSHYIVRAYRSFYLRPSYLWERFRRIESLEELLILFMGGMNIFQFSMTGNK